MQRASVRLLRIWKCQPRFLSSSVDVSAIQSPCGRGNHRFCTAWTSEKVQRPYERKSAPCGMNENPLWRPSSTCLFDSYSRLKRLAVPPTDTRCRWFHARQRTAQETESIKLKEEGSAEVISSVQGKEEVTSARVQDSTVPSDTSASSTQIESVVNHSALIVARNIEWGTVLLGFEQANKYTVLDEEGTTVALIAEDITGIGNAVGRQLLRTRRSFTATVFSADGSQVIFRIRRPMYLITSSMYIENGDGDTLGEIQQRWHLWKRNYDLYLNKNQFAQIEGNFLAWEFELKDENGGTLALIDRNFVGFAKELFTDAGKYVIHFGESPIEAAEAATKTLQARTNNPELTPVTPVAKARTGVKVIPTVTGNQLVVAKRLNLTQRMIALACAMTIDFDYFSRHSSGVGYLTPPIFMPIPTGSEAPAAETAEGDAAATVSPDQATGDASFGSASEADGEILGGDEPSWTPDDSEILDEGDGGGMGGLFENLKDFFEDS